MVDGYNVEWCKEKHGYIDEGFRDVNNRLRKVENRFLAMMTLLIANLFGVIGTLMTIIFYIGKVK